MLLVENGGDRADQWCRLVPVPARTPALAAGVGGAQIAGQRGAHVLEPVVVVPLVGDGQRGAVQVAGRLRLLPVAHDVGEDRQPQAQIALRVGLAEFAGQHRGGDVRLDAVLLLTGGPPLPGGLGHGVQVAAGDRRTPPLPALLGGVGQLRVVLHDVSDQRRRGVDEDLVGLQHPLQPVRGVLVVVAALAQRGDPAPDGLGLRGHMVAHQLLGAVQVFGQAALDQGQRQAALGRLVLGVEVDHGLPVAGRVLAVGELDVRDLVQQVVPLAAGQVPPAGLPVQPFQRLRVAAGAGQEVDHDVVQGVTRLDHAAVLRLDHPQRRRGPVDPAGQPRQVLHGALPLGAAALDRLAVRRLGARELLAVLKGLGGLVGVLRGAAAAPATARGSGRTVRGRRLALSSARRGRRRGLPAAGQRDRPRRAPGRGGGRHRRAERLRHGGAGLLVVRGRVPQLAELGPGAHGVEQREQGCPGGRVRGGRHVVEEAEQGVHRRGRVGLARGGHREQPPRGHVSTLRGRVQMPVGGLDVALQHREHPDHPGQSGVRALGVPQVQRSRVALGHPAVAGIQFVRLHRVLERVLDPQQFRAVRRVHGDVPVDRQDGQVGGQLQTASASDPSRSP